MTCGVCICEYIKHYTHAPKTCWDWREEEWALLGRGIWGIEEVTFLTHTVYSTRHNYTGGGPNSQTFFWHAPGQPKLRLSNSDTWKL